MNQEMLSTITGIVISVVFRYLPKLKDWYYSMDTAGKQLFMAGVLVIVSGVMFGLSCIPDFAELFPEYAIACSSEGLLGYLHILLPMLVSNQAFYSIIKK